MSTDTHHQAPQHAVTSSWVAIAASLGDQAGTTLVQFGALVLTARVANPDEFGRYSMALLVFIITTGAYQAVPGTWMLTATPDHGPAENPRMLAGAVTATTLFLPGVFISLFVLYLSGSYPLTVLLSMMVMTSARLVIDANRLNSYRQGRPLRACAISLSSAGLFVLLGTCWWIAGERGGWSVPTVIQAAALLTVCLFLLVHGRIRPHISAYRYFRNRTSGTWGSLSVSYCSALGSQILVPSGVAAVAGYAVVGFIRGGQSVVSIPLQIPRGLQPMFTTRAARHYLQRGRPVISDFFLWTALQAFLVLPFLILLLFIPDSAGEAFLGDIWLATRKLLPILLVGSFLAQLVVAGEIYFRVVDRVSKFAWLRFVMVIPTVGLATMGALWGDAEGASWGLLLANAVTLGATAALVYADNKQSLSTSEPEGVTVD